MVFSILLVRSTRYIFHWMLDIYNCPVQRLNSSLPFWICSEDNLGTMYRPNRRFGTIIAFFVAEKFRTLLSVNPMGDHTLSFCFDLAHFFCCLLSPFYSQRLLSVFWGTSKTFPWIAWLRCKDLCVLKLIDAEEHYIIVSLYLLALRLASTLGPWATR